MKHILFVCTGNAGRSQMAEAIFRSRTADTFEIWSAGVDPWDDLHPMARKLMAERNLDLTGHHPKHVREFADQDLDVVVTIGDRAEAESPDFRTGVRRIHWPVADPADADGTPDSESVFRATCARIEAELEDLARILDKIPERADSVWAPAVSTTVFRPNAFHPVKHVPMLVAAGFRHIELCCYQESDFPWETPAAVTELKQVAADHGLTVLSVHPPDRGVLASVDRLERECEEDVVLRSMDLALELGAASLSLHAGFKLPVDEQRAAALAAQEAALDRLGDAVAGTPLVLCLESLPGRASDLPNAEVVRMIHERAASNFGFVLDTGHAHIARELDGLASLAGRRLQSLHLHDNDGQQDQHLIPGDGTIDWQPFMCELRTIGYEGPLMLEVQVSDGRDVEAELKRCHRILCDLMSQERPEYPRSGKDAGDLYRRRWQGGGT